MTERVPQSAAGYLGRTERSRDVISSATVERLAITLGVPVPAEGHLPPLWHWLLFQQWLLRHELGRDGHPARGKFLPPLPETPRRMWAGGRCKLGPPLRIGEQVTRLSTIRRIEEKTGSSGRFVVVTVGHEINGASGAWISEEQNLVYLSAQRSEPVVREHPPAPAGAFVDKVTPDPVTLFRFSALTGNGHRIHYDQDYARGEEGYPGLVVHGPLQALWLLDLLSRHAPKAVITEFEYRGHRAAIADRPLRLEGWVQESRAQLRTVDASGRVCLSAEATLDGWA